MIRKRREEKHPSDTGAGPITAGDWVVGTLFVLLLAWLFLAGLPPSNWFLVGAVPVGILAAIALRVTARNR